MLVARFIAAVRRLSAVFTAPLARARMLPPRLRGLLAAAICALCILAVAGTLLATSARQAPHPSANAGGTPLAVATDTFTSAPTLTARPTATHPRATATPRAVQAPSNPGVPTPPPATPTFTFCPTPTAGPTATPSPTASPTPIPTATSTPTGTTGTAAAAMSSRSFISCVTCPYYQGDNPSQDQIRAALYTAADTYHLPRNLLLAVAWQESRWHEDVLSCDGGIGLMQLQYYTWPWLNQQSVPACGLGATSYDPNTLQGNANLGAKFLAWLSCFYSYWGNNGGSSPSNPGAYTMAWYYQQANLPYPDSKNADGTPNPNSLCAAVFDAPSHPEYAALPSTTSQPWSCPYSAMAGDPTLLDFTLSAYNEGPGYTDQYGIQNWWYVQGVEGFVTQFAAGTLP
ncbi:MAG TPA: transglycosylase SLT domain-containing protein [Ktedonobacterales bacterium]|nr:transglycosylase SLT domain-containing protein [Ktedonobacterales bacterium]